MICLGPVYCIWCICMSYVYGVGIGIVCLVIGIAKCSLAAIWHHIRWKIKRFAANTYLNPGAAICFVHCCQDEEEEEEQCDEDERRLSADENPLSDQSWDQDPPAYSDTLLPPENEQGEMEAPPAYTASVEVGVLAVATTGLPSISESTDTICRRSLHGALQRPRWQWTRTGFRRVTA